MDGEGSVFFLLLPTMLVCVTILGIMWFRKAAMGHAAKNRLPPGPRALPVIGHLHLLGKLPHQSMCQLAKVHGPLMSLRLGSVGAIVASTPETAKEILQTHDQAFASRARTAAAIHVGFNCSDIAFSPQGPYWRLMRQVCVTELFSNKRMESFRPIRAEEIHALLRSVIAESVQFLGQSHGVVIRPKLLAASNNIISRMTIGQRLSELAASSSQADPSHNITDLIQEMLHLFGVFNVGDFIPLVRWMDLQGYERRMKMVGHRMSYILQEVVDRRRHTRAKEEEEDGSCTSPTDPKDLLDVLLSVSDITDSNIKAVLQDMFIGGTDTTSITTEWALAELLANPTTLKTLQHELDSVVGKKRLVQEAHIYSLPYLHAVVKEAMRLHPIAPLLIPRESTQPCQIFEYMIPPKTRTFVNVWAIGRDADVWEKPQQFLPERFLEGSYSHAVNTHGQYFQLLPFGSGRRKCPALTLGLESVHIMLASLIQGFDWALPTSKAQVDLSETFGLAVMMTSPLVTIPTPRLPAHLYEEAPQ